MHDTHTNIKVLTVRCPQCGKLAAWTGNPDRPFCSERCRHLDLGSWADESYRVPGDPVPEFPEETD